MTTKVSSEWTTVHFLILFNNFSVALMEMGQTKRNICVCCYHKKKGQKGQQETLDNEQNAKSQEVSDLVE